MNFYSFNPSFKVPVTPNILTPDLIFEAIKSLSPVTVTEERPSYPVLGVIY